MDMFNALREGAQEKRPANDLENLMATKRWLHGYWIERKEEVSVVGEHPSSKHVVQLAEGWKIAKASRS